MSGMRNIAIIGLGMMGGSLALSIKKSMFDCHIIGIDIDGSTSQQALTAGIVDAVASELKLGVAEADLVVLATPVGVSIRLLYQLYELGFNGIVTDLGSTKQALCETAIKLPGLKFVGGHPMAGSEIVGIIGANGTIFENAPVIITPMSDTDQTSVDAVCLLWERLHAHITVMDPVEHDHVVSIVSHLPYVAAIATMNAAGNLAQEKFAMFSFAAGGFRDTTRIAAGDPTMWRDIFCTNRSRIMHSITELKSQLDVLEQALLSQDGAQLLDFIKQAQRRRKCAVVPNSNVGMA
jgi:prephenate dehydrogenase